jgi:hypothetical protein
MKSLFILLINLLIVNLGNLKASDTIYFSNNLPQNIIAIDYKKSCQTFREPISNKIYQFRDNSITPSISFQFNQKYEKLIFDSYFNDNGKSYKLSKKAYEVNQIYTPLCKTEKYFVDDKNNIYTIVSGLCARVNPKGNPEEDFIMEGFFSVIKLGNDTIENIYPIDDPFINPDYYILNFANFYCIENGFVFTLANQTPEVSKKYFLGNWIEKNGRLKFNKLIETELPSFHVKNKIEYNLMDFFVKGDKLAFYMGDAIIDINNHKEYNLTITDFPITNFANIAYGGQFDIKFSLCDFIQQDKQLKVIYRKNNSFYYAICLLENGKYIIQSEKEMKQFSLDNIARMPFFDEEGKILFEIKDKNYFLRLSLSEL